MGWTCTDKPHNVKEYFDKMHVSAHPEKSTMRVLKSALKNFREYYAAVEITNRETGESKVVCSVIICNFYKDYGTDQISYKEMMDSCGPNVDNCPESILKLLTDTDSQYAIDWRDRCWAKINMRKAINGMMKHGTKVQFEPALEFGDGTKHSELYVWKGCNRTRFAPYPTKDVGTGYFDMPIYRVGKRALQSRLVLS